MPNNDGTGPRGEGPKTGRGFGSCNKDNNSVDAPRMGRGQGGNGRGLGSCGQPRGQGRGRRCRQGQGN